MKLISIPANPAPEGVATAMLKTPDGVSIRYARWEPPSGRKGTVCIFQGRTEFIEKYFDAVDRPGPGAEFAAHGIGRPLCPGRWPGEPLDHAVRQQSRHLRSGAPRPRGRGPGGRAGAGDRRSHQCLDERSFPGDGGNW